MIKSALLFDFDGVLVNSEPFYCQLWIGLLKAFDKDFNKYQLRGKSNAQFLNQFNLTQRQYDYLLAWKYRLELEFFENSLIEPTMLKFLIDLKSRHKLCIVSNNKLINIEAFLKSNKCIDLFDFIISEEFGLAPKPSPDAYLKAQELFEIEKNQAMIIEDSKIGLEAAENAKIDYIKFSQNNLEKSIETIKNALYEYS